MWPLLDKINVIFILFLVEIVRIKISNKKSKQWGDMRSPPTHPTYPKEPLLYISLYKRREGERRSAEAEGKEKKKE